MEVIQYGISENYLKDWGIQEALREIYQNFLDYGKFNQKVVDFGEKSVRVTITNTYNPKSLEFLQIGGSFKQEGKENIGQHGEGLKMAMLVFLRLGYKIRVNTKYNVFYPEWNTNNIIGKTLSIVANKSRLLENGFSIVMILPKKDFEDFNANMIRKSDVLFTAERYGDIVNKPVGNLYVGRLFVCNVKNLKKSYNLLPSVLKLDRDRRVPAAFETSWNTSKINEAEGKVNFIDQEYDDQKYISSIPAEQLKTIKPKIIGNQIEFVAKTKDDSGKEVEVVIKNSSIKEQLKVNSYFRVALNKIKLFLLSKFHVLDAIVEFRNKYCYNDDARQAFDDILKRLGIDIKDKINDLPF